jgi:uncharacterized protein YndB with AHSA1/START domain
MTDTSFTKTIDIDRPANEVFAAINRPETWWSESITGRAGEVGAEFVFDSGDGHHVWQFRVTELVPDKLVVWRVFDSVTGFVADHDEWNDTEVRFEISGSGDTSTLHFTHDGLTPDLECFEGCSMGWTGYITQSLPNLLTTGTGHPGRY